MVMALCLGLVLPLTAEAAQDARAAVVTVQPATQASQRDIIDHADLGEAGDGRDGFRLGTWLLSPALSLHQIYQSNLYATENNAVGDYRTQISPALSLTKTAGRHRGSLYARTDIARYADYTKENYSDTFVGAKADLAVIDGVKVKLEAERAAMHEVRGDVDSPTTAAEPVTYDQHKASLVIAYQRGVLGLDVFASIKDLAFDNVQRNGGGVLIQDDRDRTETVIGIRPQYQPYEGLPATAYVEVAHTVIDYARRAFDATSGLYSGNVRDSDGVYGLLGARLPVTAVTHLDAAFGYIHHQYDAGGSSTKPKIRLALSTKPSAHTAVTAEVDRTLRPSTTANALSYVSTQAKIQGVYDVREAWRLMAGAGYDHLDFKGIDRTDKIYTGSIGATYALTPMIDLEGRYGYTRRASSAAGRGYQDNTVMMTVRYGF
jgi:hypothetical protein